MINPLSEPIVKNFLPALRSIVAQELYSRGYSQSEIAEMMDITQPAVSQYLNRVRGKAVETIKQHNDLLELALSMAGHVSRGDKNGVEDDYREFCRLLVQTDEFEALIPGDKNYLSDL